ncbi:MAG: hypothetical protein NTZ08_13070 [Verrucomicrobia bacterium]|nr:hypothetical protein [Verrucomicrobiota bacterium]
MEKQAVMLDFRTSRLSQRLELDASLAERAYAMIAEIDGVKNGWRLAGRLQARTLERLVRSVIVTSTGASNRIEGNKLSDAEVEALYSQLRIKKFRTRDQQEVAGYLEVLESVFQNHREMSVGESLILQLHRDMLRHSEKDERHAGIYKFGPNRVEAKDVTGQVVGIIFDPTPPHLVPKEMHPRKMHRGAQGGLLSGSEQDTAKLENRERGSLGVAGFFSGNRPRAGEGSDSHPCR